MHQGFVFFHAACNHQRHLLIAVECLQRQMEDRENDLSEPNGEMPTQIVTEIIALLKSMIQDMENFTYALLHNWECLKSAQQFWQIEGSCYEMLDASLFVIQTALVVDERYGHSHSVAHELHTISTRIKWIRAQLFEYANPAISRGGFDTAGDQSPGILIEMPQHTISDNSLNSLNAHPNV